MIDPYEKGMFKESPYYEKSDIKGNLVVVLQGKFEDRGLCLIKPVSRCVSKHEVSELIVSDEPDIKAGGQVNKIAYIGFVEITQSGVIIIGDKVYAAGDCIGSIAGFDETHMPNHLNIIIGSDKRADGAQLGLKPGDIIEFKHVKNRYVE